MQAVGWLMLSRYGGTLMARGELMSYNFLVVYLAIIQGSLAAGQWLSFGPSMRLLSNVSMRANRFQILPKFRSR
jgi:ATP-binding cassette subfamily B (MDR/TAP) protein 1